MDVYWVEQAEADVPPTADWLSPPEAAHLDGLRFPKRRTDWRLGRWTAKRALAEYLDCTGSRLAFGEIQIRPAPDGAPEVLLNGDPLPLSISISHRAGIALCTVAPGKAQLGCDLELAEHRSEAFLRDYFTPEEQGLLRRGQPATRSLLATLFWSAKESVLKALRTGLRADTRSVSVVAFGEVRSAGCGNWQPVLARLSNGVPFRGWWRADANLVRTILALPAPRQPVMIRSLLEIPPRACAGAIQVI
ncbi:MAG: 4'-phosphopantetheinyl transferase superfamily protein [Bryobacteraceae bacterium]